MVWSFVFLYYLDLFSSYFLLSKNWFVIFINLSWFITFFLVLGLVCVFCGLLRSIFAGYF